MCNMIAISVSRSSHYNQKKTTTGPDYNQMQLHSMCKSIVIAKKPIITSLKLDYSLIDLDREYGVVIPNNFSL